MKLNGERDNCMKEINTKTIAVCGKGGVGKTSISAMMVKLLVEKKKGKKILAIDADPAVGLSTALGIEIGKTVDDIRKEIIEEAKQGSKEDKLSVLSRMDYEVFKAMEEKEGFAFLAIGRPESDGCYCKVNTYLREIIKNLASGFDYVIIDGEAGIEQINRRVMETVSHLLLVSDPSYKGVNVIKTISQVAENLVEYEKIGVVLNRVQDKQVKELINLGALELLNMISEDPNINKCDIKGDSIIKLPETKAVEELEIALQRFGIL